MIRKIMLFAALLSLVQVPLVAADYDDNEIRASRYICETDMAPNLDIPEKSRTEYCRCVLEGWQSNAPFADIMLAYVRIGQRKIDQKSEEAAIVVRPLMECGVDLKLF